MRYRLLIVFLFAGAISACVAKSAEFVGIPNGEIATPGVTITAQDGSFTLKNGAEFAAPFHANLWARKDQSAGSLLFGAPKVRQGSETFAASTLRNDYEEAVKRGAKRIRVAYPGLEQPLYGILALNVAPTGAYGPAARYYRIEVPQQYVEAARGGAVSVVYEVMNYRGESSGSGYSWVLWLSDRPF